MYGLNPQRTRYLPARGIKPPFRKLWRYTERPLLEFPPIYVGGTLYAVNNSGFAFALDAKTGKKLWERRIGRLNASSPTYYKHRLYIVNLVPGHIVKLNATNGKIDLEKDPAGPGRVLAGGGRQQRLLRLRRRQALLALDRQRQHPLGDPARRPGEGGARLLRRPALRRRLRRRHERGRREDRQADLADRLARDRGQRRRVLLDPGGRLRPRLRRQQRRPRLQLRPLRRRTRLDLLDRRLRLLGADRRRAPSTARRPSTSAPSTATSTR